jgi:hypothetical protein
MDFGSRFVGAVHDASGFAVSVCESTTHARQSRCAPGGRIVCGAGLNRTTSHRSGTPGKSVRSSPLPSGSIFARVSASGSAQCRWMPASSSASRLNGLPPSTGTGVDRLMTFAERLSGMTSEVAI